MKMKKLSKSELFIDNGTLKTKNDISSFIKTSEIYGYHLKRFEKITTFKDNKYWILVSLQKEEKIK